MNQKSTKNQRVIVGVTMPVELRFRNAKADAADALAANASGFDAMMHMHRLGYNMSQARVIKSTR